MGSKVKTFSARWYENNLFDFSILEGFCYFLFYGIIPFLLTLSSFLTLKNSALDVVYFYLLITISALNCLFDVLCRWRQNEDSTIRTKLLLLQFQFCWLYFMHYLKFLLRLSREIVLFTIDSIGCFGFISFQSLLPYLICV